MGNPSTRQQSAATASRAVRQRRSAYRAPGGAARRPRVRHDRPAQHRAAGGAAPSASGSSGAGAGRRQTGRRRAAAPSATTGHRPRPTPRQAEKKADAKPGESWGKDSAATDATTGNQWGDRDRRRVRRGRRRALRRRRRWRRQAARASASARSVRSGHGAGTGTGQGFGCGHGRLGGAHVNVSAKVRMGATSVSGRLPPEVIQRIVRQNFGRFRICYEQGLHAQPEPRGSRRGPLRDRQRRRGLQRRQRRLGPARTAASSSCVPSAFYGLSFPQPEGGVVTVVFPILFSPGQPGRQDARRATCPRRPSRRCRPAIVLAVDVLPRMMLPLQLRRRPAARASASRSGASASRA